MKQTIFLAACVLASATMPVFDAHAHKINPAIIERLTGETVEVHGHQEEGEPADPRGEERTYASFPEWYIVYSAQEYATFVSKDGRPSQFPYFASAAQYWDAVAKTKLALGDTEIDSTTQTVLRVIGISFSVENTLIGLYETTVGRFFEFTHGRKTLEDRYTERVAEEYGAFLLHTPWYAFPYGQKLIGLWSTYGWSSLTPRGMERRIAFTFGYGIKGIYGGVLGYLSQTSLGVAELQTVFETDAISAASLDSIEGVEIEEQWPDGHVRAVAPRYRAFTPIVEAIAAKGGGFISIQDHDEIMATLIIDGDLQCDALKTREIFSQEILTAPPSRRVALRIPVAELADTVRAIESCKLTLEHLYDY